MSGFTVFTIRFVRPSFLWTKTLGLNSSQPQYRKKQHLHCHWCMIWKINVTFRWKFMIIMWLKGSRGLYTCLRWSRNYFLDELQIELPIWISIPQVYQADFQLQLRHVEAAAKSERDKMEDGSCWWLDPENPGNAQPKPKKTCNVSDVSLIGKFLCKRTKHTLSLGILPRQINLWFLTSYDSFKSMWESWMKSGVIFWELQSLCVFHSNCAKGGSSITVAAFWKCSFRTWDSPGGWDCPLVFSDNSFFFPDRRERQPTIIINYQWW